MKKENYDPAFISIKVMKEGENRKQRAVRVPSAEAREWRTCGLNMVRTDRDTFAFIKGRNGRGVPVRIYLGKARSETGYWTFLTGKNFAIMRPATRDEVKREAKNTPVRIPGEVSKKKLLYLGGDICKKLSENGSYMGSYCAEVRFGSENYIRIRRGGEDLPNMLIAQTSVFGNIKNARLAEEGSFSFSFTLMNKRMIKIPSCLTDMVEVGDVLPYEFMDDGSVLFHLPEQTCCACGKKVCRHKRLPVSNAAIGAMVLLYLCALMQE